jgi:hypothetical protein
MQFPLLKLPKYLIHKIFGFVDLDTFLSDPVWFLLMMRYKLKPNEISVISRDYISNIKLYVMEENVSDSDLQRSTLYSFGNVLYRILSKRRGPFHTLAKQIFKRNKTLYPPYEIRTEMTNPEHIEALFFYLVDKYKFTAIDGIAPL